MNITERFLKYVGYGTNSDEKSETCPSTPNQLVLGAAIAEELKALGLTDVEQDADGYVYGYLPGEGEAEFEELCDFLREAKIERAGVFPYSPEEGTPAALMPDRCSTEEAQRRAELCMEIQAEIMDGFAETFIGRELDVLVMGREPDGTPWGRSEYDSPDIDSRVIFSGGAAPGDMVRVRIDSVDDGELIGEQI
mgnify:CR=1 FL=1